MKLTRQTRRKSILGRENDNRRKGLGIKVQCIPRSIRKSAWLRYREIWEVLLRG